MKHPLFSLTDKKLLESDSEFWTNMVAGLCSLYKDTQVTSEGDKETKAVVCAKLAGLGLAIHEHFSNGVAELNSLDSPSMIDIGERAYNIGMKHVQALSALAKKQAN